MRSAAINHTQLKDTPTYDAALSNPKISAFINGNVQLYHFLSALVSGDDTLTIWTYQQAGNVDHALVPLTAPHNTPPPGR